MILNATEARVLGSLIEKEITTPDYYPLSLNALVNACNQSSNRAPVVSYDEATVLRALDGLRDKKLAVAFSGAESRVAKYKHRAGEALELMRPELAILCELLLRGPQTIGELRTRCARMHEFASLEDVEASLQRLATRQPQPFVTRLPRQPGFKESRHAQLLTGEAVADVPVPAQEPVAPAAVAAAETERVAKLEGDIDALRQQIATLQERFAEFRKQFE